MPFLSIILIVLHTCIGMIQYSIFSLQQHFNIRDSGGLPSRRAENRSDRSRQRTCIWDQTRPSYLGRKRPERSWMYSSTPSFCRRIRCYLVPRPFASIVCWFSLSIFHSYTILRASATNQPDICCWIDARSESTPACWSELID